MSCITASFPLVPRSCVCLFVESWFLGCLVLDNTWSVSLLQTCKAAFMQSFQQGHQPLQLKLRLPARMGSTVVYGSAESSFGMELQWGELSKRPQAGVGGMPDLALQLRVSKNALRSPALQEEIVSQVSFCPV